MTKLQRKAMTYIRAYHSRYDNMPTIRNICQFMGYKSTYSAVGLLNRLVKHGHLERIKDGKYRFSRKQCD